MSLKIGIIGSLAVVVTGGVPAWYFWNKPKAKVVTEDIPLIPVDAPSAEDNDDEIIEEEDEYGIFV